MLLDAFFSVISTSAYVLVYFYFKYICCRLFLFFNFYNKIYLLCLLVSGNRKKRDSKQSLLSSDSGMDALDNMKNRRPSKENAASDSLPRTSSDHLSAESSNDLNAVDNQQNQQSQAARLIQCLNTALVLSQHHITQYEM